MWEYLKSIILGLLVTISLLVTFALWTYQPEYDELTNENYLEVATKLTAGTQQPINGIIEPKLLLFHQNSRLFSLEDKSKTKNLYEQVLKWPLSDFERRGESDVDKDSSLEIIYPTGLPLSTLASMFNVNEEIDYLFPFSVDRMFISLSPNDSISTVHFVSEDSDATIRAVIRNFEVYDYVQKYLANGYDQVDYFSVDENREIPIYLPEIPVTLPMHTITATFTQVDTMKNILFNNPRLVKRNSYNSGEIFYNIDNRLLRIVQNGKRMIFEQFQSQEPQSMSLQEIIRQSLNDINDHNGWTDNAYNLFHIESRDNTIDYRLFKNGYPVLDENELGLITQKWRNQDLIEYKRPLIVLKTPLEPEAQQMTLPSGRSILSYIEDSREQLSPYLIEDIQIGYTMDVTTENPLVISMKPAWFIKEVGAEEWEQLRYRDNIMNQGGRE